MINILNVDHINFMVTIKSYTDISQSKTLGKILSFESADMYWKNGVSDKYIQCFTPFVIDEDGTNVDFDYDIPCWSLAALLEQLSYELCDDDGNSSYLQMNKEDDVYQLVYADPYGEFENIETDRHEHFVDACYEMILKLKELNLL